jgi:Trk K+ transport system NAD-binding subunit
MSSQSDLSPPSGPVVLCGLGRFGLGILTLLRRLGEAVTVITLPAEGTLGVLPFEGLRIITGDARDERILEQAGLAQAKALIAATDNDLVNVTIALHARKTAPEVPVVVRLFDQNLAGHLRSSLGIRQGYSTSALAAPSFVAAALGDTVLTTFEAGGESWAIEQHAVEDASPWVGRRLRDYAATGPVVLAHGRGTDFSTDPDPDKVLAAGDRLTVLAAARRCPRRRSSVLTRLLALARGLREWWISTPRGLRFAVYALLTLVGISVGVFHWAMDLSPVDAYYFVVTTLTTTGYGDVNLQHAPALVKLYGTLVMVSGAALFAVLFSMVTDLLLRTRFGDLLAQGMNRQRNHIIVAGLGHTGFRVLRELSQMGDSLVAIEHNEAANFLGTARTLAPVVSGNAGASETLRRAGLAGAKTILAVTNDDLTDLLAVRMQDALGIDAVISVTKAASPTFVGSALDADVLRGLVVQDHLLLIVDRELGATAPAGERPLFFRKEGATFAPATPTLAPAPGDHVLAVRWRKLQA